MTDLALSDKNNEAFNAILIHLGTVYELHASAWYFFLQNKHQISTKIGLVTTRLNKLHLRIGFIFCSAQQTCISFRKYNAFLFLGGISI